MGEPESVAGPLGLSNKMLNVRHFDDLIAMAEGGIWPIST